MRSMTGFGRAQGDVGAIRYTLELRSVNHRFFECKTRLPWPDPGLEATLVGRIRKRIDRGALQLLVRAEDSTAGSDRAVSIDVERAQRWHAAIAELGRSLGYEPPTVSLERLVTLPGVLEGEHGPAEGLAEALLPLVEQAIDALLENREREGTSLQADMQAHTQELRRLGSLIGQASAATPQLFQLRLEERLQRLLKSSTLEAVSTLDPERLAHEVALLADRIDISEESTRLALHLDELDRLLSSSEAVGRRIDFLLQELNREINTMGSKSPSAEVAMRVIECKSTLEKIREQAANIE